MFSKRGLWLCVCTLGAVVVLDRPFDAQTLGQPENFNATAIVNNNLGAGAGRVLIRITRWSTAEETKRLVTSLKTKGEDKLLDELKGMKSVGTIRTPDTLAYDLRFAHEQPGEDGGRTIVLATDRPIGFWETRNQPRTIQYPFTVVQMQIGRDGNGQGTLSYATRIRVRGDTIELENYATQPVMLTEIRSEQHDKAAR
ncbi:MAG TPA: hypothetical protein VKB50_29710 [Vicinamibacterales bacterium]|nr:hypothetical protein [Vicinamibacterales bacterium]